ncbi:MAG: xanthine dehydrogenase family protein molybdopterin-binding subunit, partial [Acidobacteria bacterium]|nr:xanthine dehydrogenase family protein molybdopterin-binding subunit [Acidobacteriota bacterium]
MIEPRTFRFQLNDDAAPEPERYEFREPPLHLFEVDRRGFFKLFGAGLAVFAMTPAEVLGQNTNQNYGESGGRTQRGGDNMPQQISAWLHVQEDGSVSVYTGKAEMGQNIRTSLTQQVAEELRVRAERISLVMADTDLTPYDMGTFGSRTTPQMGTQLRQIAAGARQVLLQRAAQVWAGGGTSGASQLPQSLGHGGDGDTPDTSRLSAANGAITNTATGQTLTYQELVRGQHLFETVVTEPPVTPPAEWKTAGQPAPKVDGAAFVTGAHRYASDIERPGMAYGKIVRPSAFNSKLESADVTAAQQLPGVTVVHDGDFIGVVAPTSHAAQSAAARVHTNWSAPKQIAEPELYDYLRKTAKSAGAAAEGRRSANQAGDPSQAFSSAAKKIERTYTVAYIQHAPLEPRAAVAEWATDGRLTVWTGTQRPFAVKDELARAFHLDPSQVRVIVPDTGSAYGGKHTGECAVEAARLAKAASKPVKLIWTREEEFTWAYFRPAGVIDIRAAASNDGRLVSWEHDNYNSGPSAIEVFYDVPNKRVQFHETDYPLRQGSYRGLAATANHFARESAMDELAHELVMDPLEFRLKNIEKSAEGRPNGADPERLRAVFQAAAEKFNWHKPPAADTFGYGIAGGFEKGGYVACAVEVQVVKPQGEVRLRRVVEAWDCGAVVNPDGLRNQIAGAVVQGIGGALFEAIHFENGRILNPHFAEYRVPRFTDAPP